MLRARTFTVKMALHCRTWLHATGQLPSANRTWSAAVHDGQLTWNQEAGADVPKPLGMAAGRRLAAQHAGRERTRPFPWEK